MRVAITLLVIMLASCTTEPIPLPEAVVVVPTVADAAGVESSKEDLPETEVDELSPEAAAEFSRDLLVGNLADELVEMKLWQLMSVQERAYLPPNWVAEFNLDPDPTGFVRKMDEADILAALAIVEMMQDWSAEQRKTAERYRYGCQLARTGASENTRPLRELGAGAEGHKGTAGHPTEDVWMIHQIAVNTMPSKGKEDHLTPLYGLAKHAGHVNGLKLPKRHRQELMKAFSCTGSKPVPPPPEAWIDARDVEDPEKNRNDGDWRVHGPHWVKYRDRVIKAYLRGRISYPCPGIPRRWGNWEDVCADRNMAGWCILACGDLNYALARVGEGCELTSDTDPRILCVEQRTGHGSTETLPADVAAGVTSEK